MKREFRHGFTLVELMIVVVIIAIIASMAVPNMLGSRKAANESAAIATLRQLSSSQAEARTSGVIDGDGDGVGEYAYFGELAGTHFVRAFIGGVQVLSPSIKLQPPVASGAFGNVQNGRVTRSGYLFRVFLPGLAGVGIPEAAAGGAELATLPDADLAEAVWCAYAWPVNHGNTSNRAFFINESGDILQFQNSNKRYSGPVGPAADAAFVNGGVVGSINQPSSAAHPQKLGMDGEVWTNVN